MQFHRRRLVLSLAVVMMLWTEGRTHARTASAQVPQDGQTVWDGVYSRPQAERGRLLFDAECRRCHDVSDFVGEDYMAAWEGQTLRAFYLYISSEMPPDVHEEIPDFLAYSELVAYLLRSNDYPPGEADLSANLDRLNLIRIDPIP